MRAERLNVPVPVSPEPTDIRLNCGSVVRIGAQHAQHVQIRLAPGASGLAASPAAPAQVTLPHPGRIRLSVQDLGRRVGRLRRIGCTAGFGLQA